MRMACRSARSCARQAIVPRVSQAIHRRSAGSPTPSAATGRPLAAPPSGGRHTRARQPKRAGRMCLCADGSRRRERARRRWIDCAWGAAEGRAGPCRPQRRPPDAVSERVKADPEAAQCAARFARDGQQLVRRGSVVRNGSTPARWWVCRQHR
eukprot:6999800-Prymnesium_polylepis.2